MIVGTETGAHLPLGQAGGEGEWAGAGSRTGAEQESGLWTGQPWLSMTREIKGGESRGLVSPWVFYTLNFLLGESKCTPQPSPGCSKGGDGSSGLPV